MHMLAPAVIAPVRKAAEEKIEHIHDVIRSMPDRPFKKSDVYSVSPYTVYVTRAAIYKLRDRGFLREQWLMVGGVSSRPKLHYVKTGYLKRK